MRAGPLVAALGAAALLLSACKSSTSSNNCGSGTAPSLAGSYTLSSYTFGNKTWTSPTSTGTLQLTASTYAYTMTLAANPLPLTVSDNGSYLILGSECIRYTSADTARFAGSFGVLTSGSVTTLHESGSDSTHIIDWTWVKN